MLRDLGEETYVWSDTINIKVVAELENYLMALTLLRRSILIISKKRSEQRLHNL